MYWPIKEGSSVEFFRARTLETDRAMFIPQHFFLIGLELDVEPLLLLLWNWDKFITEGYGNN